MPARAKPKLPQRSSDGNANKVRAVSRRVKHAIDDMAHNGADIVAAAKRAGIEPVRLRRAWNLPAVQALWREHIKVQRESLTGEALARLRTLSQQDKQLMAAVTATKALLEAPADPAQRGASLAAPGLVIHIATAPQPPQIDVTPSHVVPSDTEHSD